MQKVKMIAQGRVQGVGFRWGVYTLALELGGITGRVWNNDDGCHRACSGFCTAPEPQIRKGIGRKARIIFLSSDIP